MSLSKSLVLGCGAAALLFFLGAVHEVRGATIVAARTDNMLHNDTNSPFFTSSATNVPLGATANGWAPIAPTKAAAATTTSTTPKKSFTIVGNSTAAGNWVDGTGVPAGITLTFDAQFTVTALPSGSLLTTPAPTGSGLGQGIGITQTVGGGDDIDVPDGIQVGAVAVSSVVFAGTLADPNFNFSPGGVSGFGTILIRSNNFVEATAGMLLTGGSGTIGFGTQAGTIASNLLAENNFGPPGSPASSFFPRQSAYTLAVTQGTSVIKGLTLGYDVTYNITAIPEPGTLWLAAMGVVVTARAASRRRTR